MTESHITPLVIKLGGAALSCVDTLSQVFGAIASYRSQSQRPIVVVHGGGYLVDDLLEKLNIETVKKNGLRVTPYDHIPLIVGALAGTANKLLQGQAITNGLDALGLSLADGGLCRIEELDPDLGAVGKAMPGKSELLQTMLDVGALPIISSIGLNEQGQMMNVNADQAAVAVAGTLNAELVFLSDVSGVLDGKGHLIKCLDEKEAQSLIAGHVITDGMIVKVNAALDAANNLGRAIEVATWRYPDRLIELFAGKSIGTQFLPKPSPLMIK
ncbi:acetylglutamate kinase [Vibrio ostreicida]|uniref:Acetylglutamate kinase n=1 Tax=Vibrio ostreicida TaxID=526588 RepID=A0ABT8BQ80_9VIBR|nr:acetylglutamate kinase [Vibrio ostreicida]MDN3608420.1 acetylglutamate kinase [Vibrio ostreicida]NPD10242.1 acetylglutamate kinase [Vibrio ostreicida]